MISVVVAAILSGTTPSQHGDITPFEITISQPEPSPSVVRVSFFNTGPTPLCFALNNGARLFDVQRRGRSLPFADGIPHGPPPWCFLVDPGEVRTEDFDLRVAFPPLERDDRLCFNAWYRHPEDQVHATEVWACNLLDR